MNLLNCPFCGAHPHKNLGKVWHDSLHGDRHQDTVIKCPHLCATMSGSASTVVDKWNTRALTPADAIAAREARDAEVREQALREAAGIAKQYDETSDCMDCIDTANIYRAILALIEKDKTNDG